jgi:transcriptional regulator with XRE-family HTH domain
MKLPPAQVARFIRRSAGLTQTSVAAALGVDRTTLARWESGKSKPRVPSRAKYADLLARLEKELNR